MTNIQIIIIVGFIIAFCSIAHNFRKFCSKEDRIERIKKSGYRHQEDYELENKNRGECSGAR